MMRLDHFVVHIDNDQAKLESLKSQIEPIGFPFNPHSGKGTKGFKVANIWIGDQYLELVWLKTKDGGGWREQWVDKYNQGQMATYDMEETKLHFVPSDGGGVTVELLAATTNEGVANRSFEVENVRVTNVLSG